MTTTIQELKQSRGRQAKIKRLDEEIEQLKSAMESTTQALSLAPGGGAVKDKLAEQMAEYMELIARRNEERIRAERLMEAVEEFIASLPEQQAKVIRLRYVDGLSWTQVADKANYGKRHCYKINEAVFKKMAPNGTIDLC